MPNTGPSSRSRGGRLARDTRGQQFVLEAIVVAIVAVTTVVMVAGVQPDAPTISEPKTRADLRSLATDTLDSMAATPKPKCDIQDGCHGGTLLHDLVLRQIADHDFANDRGKDGPLYEYIDSLLPPGVHGYVEVCVDDHCRRLAGDPPPSDGAEWEGVTAQRTFSPQTTYAHVFTDLDTYDGNDPTPSGDGSARMRVTVVPTRNGLPVGPLGSSVQLEVQTDDLRQLRSIGHTGQNAEEANNGSQPFAELWMNCEKIDDDGNPTDRSCSDVAGDLDKPHYDTNVSDDFFKGDTNDARFKITVRETAGVEIPQDTRIVVKVPPDWDLDTDNIDEPSYGGGSPNRLDEAPAEGSRQGGWTITAKTRTSLKKGTNDDHATLQFDATPPNPDDVDTDNDPEQPLYMVRSWLELGAQARLEGTVELDTTASLPETAGVLCFVSTPSPMGRNQSGLVGVSCQNPTDTLVHVNGINITARNRVGKDPIFANQEIVEGGGSARITGMQASEDQIHNGDFEDGLTGWRATSWPPVRDAPTAIAKDSLDQPHVFYNRGSDERIVHYWRTADASGGLKWSREATNLSGSLDRGSATIDPQGTFDDASDDVVHLILEGRADAEPGRGLWHAWRSGGSWNLEKIKRLDAGVEIAGIQSTLADGAVQVVVNHLDNGDRFVYLRSDGGNGTLDRSASSSCNDEAANGWWCQAGDLATEDRPVPTIAADYDGGLMHVVYKFQTGQGGPAAPDSNVYKIDYCVWWANESGGCQDTGHPVSDEDDLWKSLVLHNMDVEDTHSLDLVIDGHHRRHVVFGRYETTTSGLYYRASSPDSTFDVSGTTFQGWGKTIKADDNEPTEVAIGLGCSQRVLEIVHGRRDMSSETGSGDHQLYRARTGTTGPGCGAATETSDWTVSSIDEPGSAGLVASTIDSQESLHVASIGRPTSDVNNTVRYANSAAGRGLWSFEEGPDGFNVDSEVGGIIDAVADGDDDIHVSYQDEGTDSLKYARYNRSSGNWTTDFVDRGATDLGWRSAIAVDDGVPYIAYYAGDEIRLAWKKENGPDCGLLTNWSCTTIDAIEDPLSAGHEPERINVDVAFDDQDELVVLYYNQGRGAWIATTNEARVAPGTETCDHGSGQGTWHCFSVDEASDAWDATMVVANERVHVAWLVPWEGSVKRVSSVIVSGTPVYSSWQPAQTLESGGNSWTVDGLELTTDGSKVSATYVTHEPTEECLNLCFWVWDNTVRFADDIQTTGSCGALVDCSDVQQSTSWFGPESTGDGDLLLHGGTPYGVAPDTGGWFLSSSGISYFKENSDASCDGVDGWECSELTRAGRSDDAEERSAALVRVDSPRSRTVVLFERDAELWAMTSGDDDGTCPPTSGATTEWSCEVVDEGRGITRIGEDPALDLDHYGRPHVLHYDPTINALVHSEQVGGGWSNELVDRGRQDTPSGKDVSADWDDDGALHAVYRDSGVDQVRYLTNASGSMQAGRVNESTPDDIAVDERDGTVHAAWQDDDSRKLIYARTPGSSGSCTNSSWSCQIVDNRTRGHVALGVQSNGTVVIAYRRPGSLWVAKDTGTSSDKCFDNGATGWVCHEIDDGSWDTGQYPAVAIASDDTIGVAYHWADHIRFVSDEGSGFGSPTVVHDPSGVGWAGHYIAAAYDSSDRVRIVYEGRKDTQYPDAHLFQAAWTGSDWSIDVIANQTDYTNIYWTGLHITDDDRSVVSFFDTDDELWYANHTGDPAHTCTSLGDESPGWDCTKMRSGNVESTNIRTFGSGDRPHVTYYLADNASLEVNRWTGSDWDIVAPKTGNGTWGDVGYYADVDVVQNGTDVEIHGSYYDRGNGSLRYAVKRGGSWSTEQIFDPTDPDRAGLFSSIQAEKVVQNGQVTYQPRIAFWDRTEGMVRYAWRDASGWTVEVVNGTGDWDAGAYADMKIDDRGQPWIAYSLDPGGDEEKRLWVAWRNQSGTCDSRPASQWSCEEVEEASVHLGSDTPSGIWSSLALHVTPSGEVEAHILYNRGSDSDPSEPRALAIATNNVTSDDCGGATGWYCLDLHSKQWQSEPFYPSMEATGSGDVHGIYLVPRSSQDTDGTFFGGDRAVKSDIYYLTDATASVTSPCPDAVNASWQCEKLDEPAKPLARTDTALEEGLNVLHVAFESPDDASFLYGSNRDWGASAIAGGIQFQTSQKTLGDDMLNATRSFTSTGFEYEKESLTQTFGLSQVPSAATLELNWSKSRYPDLLSDPDDLELRTFNTTATIQRIDIPRQPVETVWKNTRRKSTGWEDVFVPVTEFVDAKGRYRLNLTVEFDGRVSSEDAQVTAAFQADDVRLLTHENRIIYLNNSRFDQDSDEIALQSNATWDRADDGNWTAEDRNGLHNTSDHYTKIWTEEDKLTRATAAKTLTSNVGSHAVAEGLARVDWSKPPSRIQLNNSFEQTFRIQEVDGDLPSFAELRGEFYKFLKVRNYNDQTSDAPSCDWTDHPEDDPCSAYWTDAPGQGTNAEIVDWIDTDGQVNELKVTFTLKDADSPQSTTTVTDVTSLDSDRTPCDSPVCSMEAFDFTLEEDVTSFIESRGAGEYVLEVRVDAEFTPAKHDDNAEATMYHLVSGFDNLLLQADYKGGNKIVWDVSTDIGPKSSTDWIMRVTGNGFRTHAPGDPTKVPIGFSNEHGTDLHHMERYGLYADDIRPGDGNNEHGYDTSENAWVKPRMWIEDPIIGKASYNNSEEAILTNDVLRAVKDQAWIEAKGGSGMFNAIALRDDDGAYNSVELCWQLDDLADAANNLESLSAVKSVDDVQAHVNIHGPVFGEMVHTQTGTEFKKCQTFSFEDESKFFFYGSYVVEANLTYTVDLGAAGTIHQGGRVLDYFTLVPPDGEPEPAPTYLLRLHLWRFEV